MRKSTWHPRIFALTVCLLAGALTAGCGADSGAKLTKNEPLTIGQVVPTLGYITLDTALASKTFANQDLKVNKVQLSGGDPTALAALDAGDIDVAAVGSEAAVTAIAKKAGDYKIVYALMPKMSLELTVSKDFLAKSGISADSPLDEKIQALKGARIGVSALGGAQERVSQWLAQRGNLDPASDLEIVNVGPPPALRAGMENGNIDAFMLTAPNGEQAEEAGFGELLIDLGSEIPELRDYYHLVLVTSKDFATNNRKTLVKAIRALNEANGAIADDPESVTKALIAGGYGKVPEDIMANSVAKLSSGLDANGALTAERMEFLLKFSAETSDPTAEDLDVAKGEGDWWTNEFVKAAQN